MYFFIVIFALPIIIIRVNCVSIYDVAVAVAIKCPCERVSNLDVNLTKVYYYNYYTAGSTEATVYGIDEAADGILNRDDFNETQTFDMIVFGLETPITNPAVDNARCIFSQLKTNAIIIDHIAYTSSSSTLTVPYDYNRAVKYSKSIGYAIGKFLCKLLTIISKSNIHIAGHSLGGHMVGYAAKYVKANCGGLKVIYGFDPVNPCFDDCPNEHIQTGQADLVVTIQCSSVVGSTAQMADFNFISNDGVTQDGCPANTLLNGKNAQKCYHYECVSIGLNPAVRSGIWVANKCANSGDTTCSGPETTMAGYRVESTGEHGKYRFDPSGLICNKKQDN